MSDNYRYEPLDGDYDIRVLTLQPASSHGDPIHISLEQVTLTRTRVSRRVLKRDSRWGAPLAAKMTCMNYEAVSYVWGSPHGNKPIWIDGKPGVAVTPSCEALLRRFRAQAGNDARRLWIDAICINQRDDDEKARQVPLMGLVYNLARRVLVWLGEGDEELEQMLDYLQQLAKPKLLQHKLRWAERLFSWDHSRPRRQPLKVVATHLLQGPTTTPLRLWSDRNSGDVFFRTSQLSQSPPVNRLCANAWFKRVWTIQEQALASQVVFHYGTATCSDRALALTIGRCAEGSRFEPQKITPGFRTFIDRWDLVSYSASTPAITKRTTSGDSFRSGGWPSSSVAGLVRASGSSQATNPRDKIYGLLGLLILISPDFATIPVQYQRPVGEVLCTFARHVIMSSRSLDILLAVEPPSPVVTSVTGSQVFNDIPSWVPAPNATNSINGGPPWGPAIFNQMATGVSIPDTTLFDIPGPRTFQQIAHPELYTGPGVRVLSLRGKRLGRIARVSAYVFHHSSANELESQVKDWKFITEGYADHWDSARLEEALLYPQLRPFLPLTDGGRLYMTDSMHIGVSRFDVRVGDLVVLLAGGCVPFILRENDAELPAGCGWAAVRGGRWSYLGPTLVHGVLRYEEWPLGCRNSDLEIFNLV